jgi:hypothetical protein
MMAGGFHLHGLFEGFWSSAPSTDTGGDVCEYRTRSMFMAKALFNRANSKDKNRRRCFQGYQGCPTGNSSRTIVFHLVCQQKIDDFWIRSCAVLRRWYEVVSSCQEFSGLYENSVCSVCSEQIVHNSLFLNVEKCKTITCSRTRYPVYFSYMLGGTVLDRFSSINNLGVIMDEKINFS